jgi:hypothetical protein
MGIYDGEGAMRTMERGSIKNKWYNEETHTEKDARQNVKQCKNGEERKKYSLEIRMG